MKASSASGLWPSGSAWAADPSSLRASRAHQGGLALLQLVQEAPLRLGKDLLARERRHLDVDAFLLQHLVLERLVRVVERVLQLVPGKITSSAFGSSVGRCSGSIARPTDQTRPHTTIQRTTRSGAPPSSRPATTRSALDGEAPRMERGYNRSVSRLGDFIKNLFATTKSSNERIAAYIIREHDRGRTLEDILDDPYVVNRCSPAEIARVMERPEVVKALGPDIAEAAKESVGDQSAS